jgi:HlyD family secretion protein
MKKSLKTTLIVVGIFLLSIIFMIGISNKSTSAKPKTTLLYATVEQKSFEIAVLTTGELQAQNYLEILAPSALQSRNLRVSSINITDLVPEGTLVDSGDYVGTLDRTDMDNTLKTELEALSTAETNFEMKMLDTAVTLSNLRDNIKNLIFSVDEAEIVLEQSKFEPPATIRKAEMSVDKALRSLEQAKQNYNLKIQQSLSDIKTISTTLEKQQTKVNDLQKVLSNFDIKSPGSGMIIYKKDQQGNKRKVGSAISSFDLVVATLPDMSSMVSRTYVNEIDISKIKKGQKVKVIMDAFSERKYDGEVISVANIGEQLPNADAKVFEVFILLGQSDNLLRPAMTSGNRIIVKTIENAVFVPISCIQYEGDKTFVYLESKKKQEVITGESNESEVIIKEGLNPGDIVYLDSPFVLALK